MLRCCKHDNGEPFGWGEVLDYLEIPWRDPEHWYLDGELQGQMNIFDYLGGTTSVRSAGVTQARQPLVKCYEG